MTKLKEYTVTVMQPVYYYLRVKANTKAEAKQKAIEADGSEFDFIEYGDWQDYQAEEVKA